MPDRLKAVFCCPDSGLGRDGDRLLRQARTDSNE